MTPRAGPSEPAAFLSTERAGRREIRWAVAAMVISSVFFLAAAPFAKMPLGQFPAFVPAYVSALVICDVVTAVLLFGQFGFVRSPAALVLACGYLFTATMTTSYALMFPGLVSPDGLLGAGPQSTSAMYIFWHAGFPLAVIAYALLKHRSAADALQPAPRREAAGLAISLSIAAVLVIVFGYTLFATAGRDYVPIFINGNHTSDLGRAFLSGDWLLSLVALLVLWQRRPHAVIDLWLIVVMCVWLFDIALAAILNTGRYDLGWYAGRIYGLLAASGLLVVLLVENGSHYARLVHMSVKLSDANDALARLSMQDSLTGVANRRSFDAYLSGQIAVARRHERDLALVLCDVDKFKAYNDTFGHQAGDNCLEQVAAALRSCCRRPADMVARYGGEEFAMILPDTGLAGARVIAETARDAVARLRPSQPNSTATSLVTISGGISVLMQTADRTAPQLIAAADESLFRAKRLGRNRMIAARNVHERV